ncbi:MAG: TIGR02221 family CRISPR-associated protein [Chloroherpetonaceae bacterium]|nr:TIGR02221 family CRISPR-associated protein [Chloroherpetonaceae bacterium]
MNYLNFNYFGMSMIGLSFLGMGNYQEVTYKFGEKACRTRFMPFATKQFFQLDRFFVAQTREAGETHGKALREICEYEQIEIPSGKTSDELWKMFSIIAEKIPENSTLVIDITHGFRSQPMIVLAIAIYLQAAKDVKIEKIIYGAFDARENDIAPVFDLTPFLDIMSWASATDQFLKFGDASSLKNQLRNTQRATYSPESPFRAFRLSAVGDKLEKLTNALALVRPEETLKHAKAFAEEIKKAQSDFQNIIAAKPFAILLEKVEQRFMPYLRTQSLFSDDGFAAQAQMIDFYLQTEQYQQAIILGRESVVSKICKIHQLNPLNRQERMKAEDLLRQWSEPLSKG